MKRYNVFLFLIFFNIFPHQILRDPFNPVAKSIEAKISLIAIADDKENKQALLLYGDSTHLVEKGHSIDKWLIADIDCSYVLLLDKNTQKKKLLILE